MTEDEFAAQFTATAATMAGSSEAWEVAAIVRECCQRFRPDLVGELTAAPDSGAFTVTSGMTGDRFRVTVTEEGTTA
jgi:hypothetical protein